MKIYLSGVFLIDMHIFFFVRYRLFNLLLDTAPPSIFIGSCVWGDDVFTRVEDLHLDHSAPQTERQTRDCPTG